MDLTSSIQTASFSVTGPAPASQEEISNPAAKVLIDLGSIDIDGTLSREEAENVVENSDRTRGLREDEKEILVNALLIYFNQPDGQEDGVAINTAISMYESNHGITIPDEAKENISDAFPFVVTDASYLIQQEQTYLDGQGTVDELADGSDTWIGKKF